MTWIRRRNSHFILHLSSMISTQLIGTAAKMEIRLRILPRLSSRAASMDTDPRVSRYVVLLFHLWHTSFSILSSYLHIQIMDHSHMDHGGMDHGGMDHGGHEPMCSMNVCSLQLFLGYDTDTNACYRCSSPGRPRTSASSSARGA